MIVVLTVGFCSVQGGETVQLATAESLSPSLYNEALRAVRIGLQWLEKQQSPGGHWSVPVFPAVTGLVVWAHLRSPDAFVTEGAITRVRVPTHVREALDYIASCAREDGGIYCELKGPKGGGLKNYNTAICAVALAAAGDPRYRSLIRKARGMLAGIQHRGKDVYGGGMGYDASTDRAYADLSNTVIALEAMRLTESVETDVPVGPNDLLKQLREAKATDRSTQTLNWDAAIAFISRCQNRPESNDQPWVGGDPDDAGGFIYHPEKSQAGTRELADGRAYPRSYASMTYAGLLSFIYAKVDRGDPRVEAAFDWICRHFTLDENPGLGPQGLYYNYHTMAKALAVYGQEVLKLSDGRAVAWRPQFVKKLISLQRIDPKTGLGYWVNDNGRWWENDPVLVTAYSILALEVAMGSRRARG